MGMSLDRHARIQYPPVAITPERRARARFLLNTYYTKHYGREIRFETVRSMRTKIIELEAHLDWLRDNDPLIFRCTVKQCVDYERIAALLEILHEG